MTTLSAAQRISRTYLLRQELERAELTAQTLRDLVEGREPSADVAARGDHISGMALGQPAEAYYGETFGRELARSRRELVEAGTPRSAPRQRGDELMPQPSEALSFA